MDYIDEIISSDDRAKMEELRGLYKSTINYIKATDLQKYREIECTLYEILEGKKLNEGKAKQWVESMKPEAKWNIEDVKSVKEKYNINIPLIDFYVLMNMLYTDYNQLFGDDLNTYINLSKAWYYDEDAPEGAEKLYCYGKMIKAI